MPGSPPRDIRMNTDQIYAATFGAVKKLIQIVESQQKEIEALKKQIDLKN